MKTARNLAFVATVLLVLVGAQRNVLAIYESPHWFEVFLVSHPECDNIDAKIFWTFVPEGPNVYQGTEVKCDDTEEDYCASNFWLEWDHEFMCEEFCYISPGAIWFHTEGANCNWECYCEFPE